MGGCCSGGKSEKRSGRSWSSPVPASKGLRVESSSHRSHKRKMFEKAGFKYEGSQEPVFQRSVDVPVSHAVSKAKARVKDKASDAASVVSHAISKAKTRKDSATAKVKGESAGVANISQTGEEECKKSGSVDDDGGSRPLSHAVSKAKVRRVHDSKGKPVKEEEEGEGDKDTKGTHGLAALKTHVDLDKPVSKPLSFGVQLKKSASSGGEMDSGGGTLDLKVKSGPAKVASSKRDSEDDPKLDSSKNFVTARSATAPLTTLKSSTIRATGPSVSFGGLEITRQRQSGGGVDPMASSIADKANKAGTYCALACTEFVKGAGAVVRRSVKECTKAQGEGVKVSVVETDSKLPNEVVTECTKSISSLFESPSQSPPKENPESTIKETSVAIETGENNVSASVTEENQARATPTASASISRKEIIVDKEPVIEVPCWPVDNFSVEKGDELIYEMTNPCAVAATEVLNTGDALVASAASACLGVTESPLFDCGGVPSPSKRSTKPQKKSRRTKIPGQRLKKSAREDPINKAMTQVPKPVGRFDVNKNTITLWDDIKHLTKDCI